MRRPGRAWDRTWARAWARALAIALAVTALLSVAAPGAGLLSPPVADAAETGLTLVTNAAYTIQPAHRRIVVSVAITARNRTVETKTHKFSFDHAFLAVQPGASGFRITGVPGATVGVAKTTRDARLLRIGFGAKLWSGKAATYRLTFNLPATGKGANPQVRVGSGLVTLPVWAFASNGVGGSTATVRFPAGWDVAVESGSFANCSGTPDGGTLLSTGPLAQPLAFFAFVSAQRPATYRETPIAVPVGGRQAELVMRAWTDDAAWGKRIGKLLTRALPVLGTEIVVPWPHDDPIVVQEAVSREAGAYAGLFDPASKRIEVAYWASDAVALHEAAHAWFNGDLVAERWAAEGFASWYAQQAATELGVKAVAPKLTEPLRLEAFPLDTWPADGLTATQQGYAYAASYELAAALAERVGPQALARAWAAAASRQGAYQPPAGVDGAAAEPELLAGPPGWRELLDLIEAESSNPVGDLFATWVTTPDEAATLDARASARASYARTRLLAADWALPRGVRDALRAWDFPTAERIMADARTVLAQRTALEALAARMGITLPDDVRPSLESGALTEASARAEAERQALLVVDSAAVTRPPNSDPLSMIGSLGSTPEADLAAAREAVAHGDLDTAQVAADRASSAWAGAWEEGRRRTMLGIGLLATLLVLGIAAIGTTRRSRRRRRRMMAHRRAKADQA